MKHKINSINLIITLSILLSNFAFARPQYSMLSGNKCMNCHVHSQGAGLRSSLGSYSKKDVGFFNIKDTWLGNAFENISDYNSFADELITFGFDYRMLSARLGGPENSKREYFTMQATPYLAVKPFDWLVFSGQYNFSNRVYPAQSRWTAFAIIQPDLKYPHLKFGMLKPSIGNFYDDHTSLVRQVASPSRALPIVPPDYAELGTEISYESLKYLSITAGIYKANNMSENTIFDDFGKPVPLAEKNSLSKLFRIAYLPRFFDNEINTNIGASIYNNSDFNIINLFAHFGWTDKISLLTEYMISDKKDLRKTNNYSVEILYNFLDALAFSARYGKASTDLIFDDSYTENYKSQQIVFGANIYPLPYIEIRPEYRIFDREFAKSYSAQWVVQLHIYY